MTFTLVIFDTVYKQMSNIHLRTIQILPMENLQSWHFKYGLILYFSEKPASQNLVPKGSNLKFDAYIYSIISSSSKIYARNINSIPLMGDRLCTQCRVIHKKIYVLLAPLLVWGAVI